jgi:RNA polymerase sigma-70 factor (ECF subfamily)
VKISKRDFPEMVKEYEPRIRRAAYLLTGSGADAEVLTEEVFVAAFGSLGRFKGKSSVYTWLYSILLRKFKDWLRAKRRNPEALNEAALIRENKTASSASQILEKKELSKCLLEAIALLPEKERTVLVSFYLEGMSYKEMARMLKCPIGTIKSRLYYAKVRVREKLKSRGFDL